MPCSRRRHRALLQQRRRLPVQGLLQPLPLRLHHWRQGVPERGALSAGVQVRYDGPRVRREDSCPEEPCAGHGYGPHEGAHACRRLRGPQGRAASDGAAHQVLGPRAQGAAPEHWRRYHRVREPHGRRDGHWRRRRWCKPAGPRADGRTRRTQGRVNSSPLSL